MIRNVKDKKPYKKKIDQPQNQHSSEPKNGEQNLLAQNQIIENDESTPDLALEQGDSKKAIWELVNKKGRVRKIQLPMDEELYEKMLWLTNNLPKMSLQKLVIAGTTAYVDAMCEKHYKG